MDPTHTTKWYLDKLRFIINHIPDTSPMNLRFLYGLNKNLLEILNIISKDCFVLLNESERPHPDPLDRQRMIDLFQTAIEQEYYVSPQIMNQVWNEFLDYCQRNNMNNMIDLLNRCKNAFINEHNDKLLKAYLDVIQIWKKKNEVI